MKPNVPGALSADGEKGCFLAVGDMGVGGGALVPVWVLPSGVSSGSEASSLSSSSSQLSATGAAAADFFLEGAGFWGLSREEVLRESLVTEVMRSSGVVLEVMVVVWGWGGYALSVWGWVLLRDIEKEKTEELRVQVGGGLNIKGQTAKKPQAGCWVQR